MQQKSTGNLFVCTARNRSMSLPKRNMSTFYGCGVRKMDSSTNPTVLHMAAAMLTNHTIKVVRQRTTISLSQEKQRTSLDWSTDCSVAFLSPVQPNTLDTDRQVTPRQWR